MFNEHGHVSPMLFNIFTLQECSCILSTVKSYIRWKQYAQDVILAWFCNLATHGIWEISSVDCDTTHMVIPQGLGGIHTGAVQQSNWQACIRHEDSVQWTCALINLTDDRPCVTSHWAVIDCRYHNWLVRCLGALLAITGYLYAIIYYYQWDGQRDASIQYRRLCVGFE